jgi:hypothetical protein
MIVAIAIIFDTSYVRFYVLYEHISQHRFCFHLSVKKWQIWWRF